MTEETALRIAKDFMATFRPMDNDEYVISGSTERPLIWIFYYNSKRWLETRERAYALMGSGPIVVEKKTGEVFTFPGSQPVADSVAEYEASHKRKVG